MYLTDIDSLYERSKTLFGITKTTQHQLEIPIMGFHFHQKPVVDHLPKAEDINDFLDDVLYFYVSIRDFVLETYEKAIASGM